MKGGCGFYVKDNFTPIPRTDLEFKIDNIGSECENCWIELVNNSGPNVLVGVFYRHPSRENSLFLSKLKSTLKKINGEKKKTIICGDFNLNLLNFEHDKQTGSFLSTMFQNNFQPCITEPTMCKKESGVIIASKFKFNLLSVTKSSHDNNLAECISRLGSLM